MASTAQVAAYTAWQALTDLFVWPALFILSIIDFFPNPARFVMRRLVKMETAPRIIGAGPSHHKGRRVLMAVDETSHEAVDWAVKSFLEPWNDYVQLVYVPEGDFQRSTYDYPMKFSRYNYYDALENVDFLWEYCERLDLNNIEFECHVLKVGKDIPATIVSKISELKPELVLMGASKRAGPEDVGVTAYQVSLRSPVPVVVVK